jgi:hypothetical protein
MNARGHPTDRRARTARSHAPATSRGHDRKSRPIHDAERLHRHGAGRRPAPPQRGRLRPGEHCSIGPPSSRTDEAACDAGLFVGSRAPFGIPRSSPLRAQRETRPRRHRSNSVPKSIRHRPACQPTLRRYRRARGARRARPLAPRPRGRRPRPRPRAGVQLRPRARLRPLVAGGRAAAGRPGRSGHRDRADAPTRRSVDGLARPIYGLSKAGSNRR